MRARLAAALGACLLSCAAIAQVAQTTTDPYGIGLPYPLVHLVHGKSDEESGTARNLRARDPYLLYVIGRDLVRRMFTFEHGVFGQTGEATIPLYAGNINAASRMVGGVARFARDHTSSCGGCHSMPYPEPGGGQTIGSTGSRGRNTPHFFGAGLIEMLGEQTRARLLALYDANGNGFFDRDEVQHGAPAVVSPSPDAEAGVDYGNLAPDRFGVPQLNSVFRVWYVDSRGTVMPEAKGLDDPAVAGFDIMMQPFGWGRGRREEADGRTVAQGGEASTVRQFYVSATDLHMGLEAHDPTLIGGPAASGVFGRSLSGALQVDFGDVVDRGHKLEAGGLSRDDPDGDGRPSELTEGDVDAAEFYMLHVPAPTMISTSAANRGRERFKAIGCAACHVESWKIEARDEARGLPGDRRLFRLEVAASAREGEEPEFTGRLVGSHRRNEDGTLSPLGGAYAVEGVYSDFKHWDIGERYYETRYDGSVQTTHRTAPLWGVGSTAPYGHSGQYLTLDEAIRAHGGAAGGARDAYVALSAEERASVVDFLNSLTLYVSDELPTDIDGDGQIADRFRLDGQDVGYERFDPRFLVAKTPKFRHLGMSVDPGGRPMPMQILENVDAVYGLDLPYRHDGDGDGFPDVMTRGTEEATR